MNALIDRIQAIVGSNGLLTGDDVSGRSDSWPPKGGCRARAIVRPATTDEVSGVLALCHEAGQTVVAHGGLTGLVGGARTAPDDLVLSLERMNRIEEVDTANRTMTVQAGAPLQRIQEAAEESGLLFPVDLGARGSATIGGNIATNAGGNSVIRYGMTREQLLGVEAVLADGTTVSSMNQVIKNNTGYDLKHLFVGSEGTLGIVTRAVLRLRPLPRSRQTALVALPDFERLVEFLQLMDTALGGTLSAFEVMWNDFYRIIVGDGGGKHGQPLESTHPYYALVESTGGDVDGDRLRFENALETAFEQELLADAVLAQSQQQREDLWAIRDDIEGLAEGLFPPLTFDISLDIRRMEAYVETVRSQLRERWPESGMVSFGHLGDGNIHLGIGVGSMAPEVVHAVEEIVYGALGPGGVISAEHGIGLEKRAWLTCSRNPAELELMRTIKRAIDPKNILNPGKILEA